VVALRGWRLGLEHRRSEALQFGQPLRQNALGRIPEFCGKPQFLKHLLQFRPRRIVRGQQQHAAAFFPLSESAGQQLPVEQHVLHRRRQEQQNGLDEFDRGAFFVDRGRCDATHTGRFGQHGLSIDTGHFQQAAPELLLGLTPPQHDGPRDLIQPYRPAVKQRHHDVVFEHLGQFGHEGALRQRSGPRIAGGRRHAAPIDRSARRLSGGFLLRTRRLLPRPLASRRGIGQTRLRPGRRHFGGHVRQRSGPIRRLGLRGFGLGFLRLRGLRQFRQRVLGMSIPGQFQPEPR